MVVQLFDPHEPAPWPYRWVCRLCGAWLGMQNPWDTCDTCRLRKT